MVLLTQVLLIAVALAAWQYLPQIEALSGQSRLLDPFFISSPSQVFDRLVDLMTGRDESITIWPYVWPTVAAAFIGLTIGMVAGGFAGLVLSNAPFLSAVLHPFIVAANAIPRIALVPIVILLVGPTFRASLIQSILVVFFVSFFSGYEGGRSVTPHLIQNAVILGASKWQIMLHIRGRYVLAWTLASLPLCATFAVISVVTAEILTGATGMGRLIYTATISAQSSLTFASVAVLSVLGVLIVGLAQLIRGRLLHWWAKQ